LLACEAVGGSWHKALPAAVGMELMHNFSLIHDDIQDDDVERRHRPTVWSIWGKPQAINAGDALATIAGLALLGLAHRGIPAGKQLLTHKLMYEACLTTIEGQYLDISYESRFDILVSDYLEMTERKTAALISHSLEVGALLGSDDEAVIRGLSRVGWNLGLAFQVRDDILGIWGDEKKTGKPWGSDIRHRKKSLPIAYALEKAKGKARRELVDIYKEGAINDEGVRTVVGILDDVAARGYAHSLAIGYRDAALEELNGISLRPWPRRQFSEIARFIVERDS
ncbi:MAG: polyprenyl synthetase family protein, partial [Dehalococcoidia bacterium]|nr:polyprenyl synthetase family protein [Dehalococcoidia bacterium]